ncbi:hypothetical protein ACRAWD_25200 [Caulobacter segnis]
MPDTWNMTVTLPSRVTSSPWPGMTSHGPARVDADRPTVTLPGRPWMAVRADVTKALWIRAPAGSARVAPAGLALARSDQGA